MTGYKEVIDKALSIEDVEWVVEMAANDSTITNAEYCEIYSYGLEKIQRWQPI